MKTKSDIILEIAKVLDELDDTDEKVNTTFGEEKAKAILFQSLLRAKLETLQWCYAD